MSNESPKSAVDPLSVVYPDADAARAALPTVTAKRARLYSLRLGEAEGVVIARNADMAKSLFFDHAGGYSQILNSREAKESLAALKYKLQGVELVRSSMQASTKGEKKQCELVDKTIENLRDEIARLEGEKSKPKQKTAAKSPAVKEKTAAVEKKPEPPADAPVAASSTPPLPPPPAAAPPSAPPPPTPPAASPTPVMRPSTSPPPSAPPLPPPPLPPAQ